jgi:hypothetical protein
MPTSVPFLRRRPAVAKDDAFMNGKDVIRWINDRPGILLIDPSIVEKDLSKLKLVSVRTMSTQEWKDMERR